MGLLLGCENLSRSFGARPLFSGLTLQLQEGERTGLIGPNGSGKSTLLRILAGRDHPDEGRLLSKRNLQIGFVEQEERFEPGMTVEEVLVAAVEQHEHLEEHQRLTRVRILAGKAGFEDMGQAAGALSGGWRKRLGIARELAREPDLLLLDEPTNHLDIEGIVWLEQLLRSASFGCLVVSHDRYFLENVTNRTIELSTAFPQGFFSTSGSYSDFLQKREEFLEAQAAQQVALASRVRREIEWLKRGAKARTTKAKYRIEAAGQMMESLADLKGRNVQQRAAGIDFLASERQTRRLLVAQGLAKSLGGRKLFADVDLILSPGIKLGLLGPNGSGKSTLLRVLVGELEPDAGQVKRAENLRIVMFDQQRQQLNKAQTLSMALSPKSDTVLYRGRTMHITGWAKQFLFRTEQLDQPVGSLSGGEQARVLIARLMLEPADVLVLDEPTNDLDIPTLEVLEESLEDFPGALVLVTHDRYLLERLCTDLLGLDGNGEAHLFSDLAQWQRAQERSAAAKKAADSPSPPAAAPASTPERPRKLSYMEQREWEQMEEKILEAEEEVHRWQRDMSAPEVLSDHVKLAEVCRKMESAQQRVAKLYERWAELEARKG